MDIYSIRSISLSPIQFAFLHYNSEIIEIMAPLSDNPNELFPAGCRYTGYTPIQKAVEIRNLEVIRSLAQFSEIPNAIYLDGWTPIQVAAFGGEANDRISQNQDAEIIKILAPLSENPNVPNPTGWTPIQGLIIYFVETGSLS